ncbi:hypothetical protein CO610_06850 [Lysobacteraceae bacterium NML95-0200]|nr:hypothetical protein CO610_06850 [Xanthomonadaceae bacterium NML95-0200]
MPLMKTSIFYAVLVAGLYGAAAMASAQDAAGYWRGDRGGSEHFLCESHDGRYRECRRGQGVVQDVRLVRQLSRTACIEGRTWGFNRGAVWVNHGCRAEFEVRYRGRDNGWNDGRYRDRDWRDGNRWGNGSGTVICESVRNNPNTCRIDTRYGVTLVRQLSSTRCREGHNWGVGNGDVWVDHGCRAEFAPRNYRNRYRGRDDDDRYDRDDLRGNWGHGGYGPVPQLIQCASHNGRQNYCRVHIPRGVELSRQLSRGACVEGRSWGWNRDGVWVSHGCRAEFRIW